MFSSLDTDLKIHLWHLSEVIAGVVGSTVWAKGFARAVIVAELAREPPVVVVPVADLHVAEGAVDSDCVVRVAAGHNDRAEGTHGEFAQQGATVQDLQVARVTWIDEERKAAVEQLKQAAYFHRQVAWLQDRFPKAELQPVLTKLSRAMLGDEADRRLVEQPDPQPAAR